MFNPLPFFSRSSHSFSIVIDINFLNDDVSGTIFDFSINTGDVFADDAESKQLQASKN